MHAFEKMMEESDSDSKKKHLHVRKMAGFYFAKELVVLDVLGSDRKKLLHGLMANEINQLPVGEGNLQHLLTPKGKIQAEAEIYQMPKKNRLICEQASKETLTKNISIRIFRSDIQLEDKSNDFFIFGLCGPQSPAILKQLDPTVPSLAKEYQHAQMTMNGERIFFCRQHVTGEIGFHLVIPREMAEKTWKHLSETKNLIAIGEKTIDSLKTEAGVPKWQRDFNPNNLSLEVNLNKAVSNSKGCYLGQEPVARIFSRGHVAKRLIGLVLEKEIDQKISLEEIEIWPEGDKREGKGLGILTHISNAPSLKGPIAYAYLKYDFIENHKDKKVDLFLKNGAFLQKAHWMPLPFYNKSGINWLAGGPQMNRVIAPQTKTHR